MNKYKLVEKAKKGDKKAFAQLIEEEKVKIYRTAFLYTKNKDDSLDIVQDSIYKALVSIKNLKEPNYFSSWLMRIVINSSLDFIKKKKKVIPLDLEIVDDIRLREFKSDYKLDLFDAIDGLKDRYRTIIILKYYQDKTLKQIAEILDLPEGTVKSNLHRALQELRSLIGEDCVNG
ncbi:sigma-70 family RNA polymerase sigma factor [Rossellomorea vietnamensis]|uniref:sigma-70 family RNA polymerase sigma factor n=1 Tax=Rossellomorea vietnamensis TaxID=218284 RepID=UPI001E56C7FB|nr:sigma-70 family RNA polymerase sigma factor [Rossellomorea vietnamensis]MCC5801251.1 sigma-70 family RNA polymerase sigma factor [Rossellomorea vietnamensis]